MYQRKLTPEEALNQIKLRMKYDSKKTLSENLESVDSVVSEQSVVGAPNMGMGTTKPEAATQQNQTLKDLANEIILATQGAGTNTSKVFDAVSKFKTAKDFWNVNAYLKTIGNNQDFTTIINDEFGIKDGNDLRRIQDHLKKLGIESTAEITSNDRVKSFTITSMGPTGTTTTNTTTNTTKTPPKAVAQTKVVFTSNNNFPLKFQQKGEKIKQLQTALDIRNRAGQPNITGKFWTATEAALKAKAAELGLKYNKVTGVTEELFNAIVNSTRTQEPIPGITPREPITQPEKTLQDINAAPAATTPATTTPAAAPNIPSQPNITQPEVTAPTRRQIRQANRASRRLNRQ